MTTLKSFNGKREELAKEQALYVHCYLCVNNINKTEKSMIYYKENGAYYVKFYSSAFMFNVMNELVGKLLYSDETLKASELRDFDKTLKEVRTEYDYKTFSFENVAKLANVSL